MILHYGRPEDVSGRLPKEVRVYDLLDSLGILYGRVDHQAAMTMEACVEIDKVMDTQMCKNLFLCNRQGTQFYLLMLPGDKVFKTKELSKQIGSSRLSFGSGEAMQQLLDITPGSLSVLGLMNDPENKVQLLIDQALLSAEFIGCHPCVNTSSLKLKTEDLLNRIIPATKHTVRTVRLDAGQ